MTYDLVSFVASAQLLLGGPLRIPAMTMPWQGVDPQQEYVHRAVQLLGKRTFRQTKAQFGVGDGRNTKRFHGHAQHAQHDLACCRMRWLTVLVSST